MLTATKHFISSQPVQTVYMFPEGARKAEKMTQYPFLVPRADEGTALTGTVLSQTLKFRFWRAELEFSQGDKGGLMTQDPPTSQAPPSFKGCCERFEFKQVWIQTATFRWASNHPEQAREGPWHKFSGLDNIRGRIISETKFIDPLGKHSLNPYVLMDTASCVLWITATQASIHSLACCHREAKDTPSPLPPILTLQLTFPVLTLHS